MELVLLTSTVVCTISIALNLYALELNNTISAEAMDALFDLFLVVMLMFTYCYLSERVTADLFDIGDIFYNVDWFQLPVNQQRFLVLPIQRSQRELRLQGLGLFDCSLAIFSSV